MLKEEYRYPDLSTFEEHKKNVKTSGSQWSLR